jgi:hypothetical protein
MSLRLAIAALRDVLCFKIALMAGTTTPIELKEELEEAATLGRELSETLKLQYKQQYFMNHDLHKLPAVNVFAVSSMQHDDYLTRLILDHPTERPFFNTGDRVGEEWVCTLCGHEWTTKRDVMDIMSEEEHHDCEQEEKQKQQDLKIHKLRRQRRQQRCNKQQEEKKIKQEANETELDMCNMDLGAEDAIMLAAEIVDNGAFTKLILKDNRLATAEAGKILFLAIAEV